MEDYEFGKEKKKNRLYLFNVSNTFIFAKLIKSYSNRINTNQNYKILYFSDVKQNL